MFNLLHLGAKKGYFLGIFIDESHSYLIRETIAPFLRMILRKSGYIFISRKIENWLKGDILNNNISVFYGF